ncbi:hypothetical protein ABH922_002104 [Rhodococcus sp. 27YEA15]|uniref:hypothetical protein n=1 Tax=Rhodococcus sp. 27YEA15 TaxID=3156259 RepID=UPI003C7B7E00
MIATGRPAMLVCLPIAERNQRSDVAYVPVVGRPESALGLVWRRDRASEHLGQLARMPATELLASR